MQAVRLAVVVGTHHAGMNDAGSVTRFSQKALHRGGVAPEASAQYLERTGAAAGVLGAVHLRRPSLADALEEAVAGDGSTGQVLVGHGVGAKLTSRFEARQVIRR